MRLNPSSSVMMYDFISLNYEMFPFVFLVSSVECKNCITKRMGITVKKERIYPPFSASTLLVNLQCFGKVTISQCICFNLYHVFCSTLMASIGYLHFIYIVVVKRRDGKSKFR